MSNAWLRLRRPAQFQALLSTRPVARSAHFVLHRWLAGVQPQAGDAAATSVVKVSSSGAVGIQTLLGPPGSVWIGVLTPKRLAKRAVTRSLMRRQMYAVFGDGSPGLTVGAYLIRLRASFDIKQFPSAASDALRHAVRSELLSLRKKALCET
jgi:ribonuclease P protein component